METQARPTSGIDLKVERIRLGYVTATALAERMDVSKSWVTRIEQKAIVSPDEAAKYRSGLATFATVASDATSAA